jgi:hypothetical protein
MSRRILLIPAVTLLFSGVQASAQVLTFQGLQNLEAIENFYNGGTGSDGDSGTNYGISFASNALAIISHAAGGTGNFSGAPGGDTIAFFANGTADTMDVAAGFNTGFSFDYSATEAGSVTVWSGLDGTGTELASIALNPNTPGTNPGCSSSGTTYCTWTPIGVSFAGTAESVLFSGAADFIGFSDITINSATAGSTGMPESGSLGLIPLELAVFGLAGVLGKKFTRFA